MSEDSTGIGAIYHPSPNHGERRNGARPELVVIHYTAMPSAALALERLCDPVWEVSAHWLIGRKGQLWSLVPESRRAWHAGAGSWGGQGDINSRSIGIEIDNDGQTPFSAPAMERLAELLRQILTRWSLPPKAVIGHSDMAPLRKSDPGARFDWRWLAEQGLSVWPAQGEGPIPTAEPLAPLQWQSPQRNTAFGAACRAGLGATDDAPARFLADASRFGYPQDLPLDVVLSAVRLRFCPAKRGELDAEDLAIVQDLARRFPAEPPKLSPQTPRSAAKPKSQRP